MLFGVTHPLNPAWLGVLASVSAMAGCVLAIWLIAHSKIPACFGLTIWAPILLITGEVTLTTAAFRGEAAINQPLPGYMDRSLLPMDNFQVIEVAVLAVLALIYAIVIGPRHPWAFGLLVTSAVDTAGFACGMAWLRTGGVNLAIFASSAWIFTLSGMPMIFAGILQMLQRRQKPPNTPASPESESAQ